MASTKQSRAYAQRRADKWEERRRQRAAQQRRRAIIAMVIVGALVVATFAGALVFAGRPPADQAPDPAAGDPIPDIAQYDAPPPPEAAEGRTWDATLRTSAGDIQLELDGAAAPQAVASFLMLARDGFFDATPCHRLVVGALLQCGDPTGTGFGGPGYSFGPIENAPEDMVYPAGTLAMARAGGDPESQGSQFFLVFADTPVPHDSAGGFTVFGRVTSGLDVLTGVDAGGTVEGGPDGQPASPVTIEGVVIP